MPAWIECGPESCSLAADELSGKIRVHVRWGHPDCLED